MKEKLAKAFSNFHSLTLHIVGESIGDYCFVVLMHNVVLNGVFFGLFSTRIRPISIMTRDTQSIFTVCFLTAVHM